MIWILLGFVYLLYMFEAAKIVTIQIGNVRTKKERRRAILFILGAPITIFLAMYGIVRDFLIIRDVKVEGEEHVQRNPNRD